MEKSMNQIFVNHVEQEETICHGIVVINSTLRKDMAIVFEENINKYIAHLVSENPKENFYFFKRAFQYVLFFQYDAENGFSMKFTDYKNNFDFALEEYLILKGNDWEQSDRDTIMKIVQEIEANPNETAEMIIENQF